MVKTSRDAAASPRRAARELALQGLYERQVAGNAASDVYGDLAAGSGYVHADRTYFDELWTGVVAQYDELVARITPHLSRKPAELSPVERAILVIGTWELVNRPEIPYKAVIDEAIELAKTYGGTDGHRFVNGVLDKVAAQARAVEIAALAR
ncbi:MAG: transcription antitermination factor NusB [Burkholderiales bacterium]|nr:transcription antitermination factor NusB [Burkholderiales bacterium]